MVDVYVSVEDIEIKLGKTFSNSTTPTVEQLESYIDVAEANFTEEFGDYSTGTVTNEIVDGQSFGLFLTQLPLISITTLEENSGTLFELDWTVIDTNVTTLGSDENNAYIDDINIGKVELNNPLMGSRSYRVTYEKGYTTKNMPLNIKEIVIADTFGQMFKSTLFKEGQVDNSEVIIDVEVYREITRGGNAFTGFQEINGILRDAKAKFKGNLKTYLM